jgi:hypothetical protein
MNTWALFIALISLGGAFACFIKAQFSDRRERRTVLGSSALMICGLVAIVVALSV